MVHKSQDDTASHVISCPHMTCHMSHDRSNVDATVAVVRCYIAGLNRSVGVHPEGMLGERDSAWRSWRLIDARGTTLVQLEWLTQTGYRQPQTASDSLRQPLQTASGSLRQPLQTASDSLRQPQTASNSLRQPLQTASDSLSDSLQTASDCLLS